MKFVYKIIFVVFVVLMVDIAIGVTLDSVFLNLPDKNTYVSNMYQSLYNKKAEVLVLGASTARHHYNCQIIEDSLGMNVYNAGLDGTDIIFSGVLLKSFIERCNIKLLLFDCCSSQFDGKFNRSIKVANMYYGIHPYVTENVDKGTDLIKKIKLRSSLYRYNGSISYLFSIAFSDKNIMKGYNPLDGFAKGLEKEVNNYFQVDSLEYERFVEIIDLCKRKNIEIVIVKSPASVKGIAFENWLNDITCKKGIKFINENDNPYYLAHPQLFRDGSHLNSNGADWFTRSIINKVLNK